MGVFIVKITMTGAIRYALARTGEEIESTPLREQSPLLIGFKLNRPCVPDFFVVIG